ncbi:MAG: TrmH family RNA methyltransferase [Bacteroidota bacterium]|nr:TrmH family RNA methyltransferase [Bacteroidota bacterium]
MISKNQINNIRSLHLKKNRDLRKQFIAEGVKTVLELIKYRPDCLVEIYATEDFVIQNGDKIASNNINYFSITEHELEKISLQSTPNKVIAICNYFENQDVKIDFNTNFILYMDDIRDPGNFGTILRLANWFGSYTVFCSPQSCDVYNPKVIQSSMGAFMRVNCKYLNLSELVNKNKIQNIYGAVLTGNNLYKQNLQNGLIVVGNEANGISAENLKLINKPITIPCHVNNGTESLNAAMAASIIIAEFYRQLGT